jgi:hypothetical protein
MKELPTRGEVIARVLYLRVEAQSYTRDYDASFKCVDLENKSHLVVNGQELVKKFVSADQVDETKQVTRTELAQRLVSVGSLPFTVTFVKADKKERVLRGRLVEHEDLLGRSMVHDFEVEKGEPIRLVDHRTLRSLIVNGVKYELKGK